MKYLLGEKLNMTEIYDEKGDLIPATILKVSPATVVQVKNKDKDGYVAVQLGFGEKKEKRISKPVKGHTKGLGNFKVLREFRLEESSELPEKGSKINVEILSIGDIIEVSGLTKSKGFQGVVKRHGFKGGPRSHGQKHSEREPGSIGGGGRDGGRVAKGMRMAGRTGGNRVTVQNLKVLALEKEQNLLFVSGAVPGRKGTILEIRSK